jgi:DNA-binding NtrC family response regulator
MDIIGPTRGTIIITIATAPAGITGAIIVKASATSASIIARFVVANILFVDDDRDIEETFGDVLRARGHEVRTASSGEQGLELLKAAALPDVVILDVDMPGMTGPAMAHEMLVHDAGQEHIPVILMSANSALAQIAGRMGTPYFLAKTGDLAAFFEMVDRAIRERTGPSSA